MNQNGELTGEAANQIHRYFIFVFSKFRNANGTLVNIALPSSATRKHKVKKYRLFRIEKSRANVFERTNLNLAERWQNMLLAEIRHTYERFIPT